MSEFTTIDNVLTTYHTIHRARSLYKLKGTYREIGIFRSQSKMELFG